MTNYLGHPFNHLLSPITHSDIGLSRTNILRGVLMLILSLSSYLPTEIRRIAWINKIFYPLTGLLLV